MKQIDKTISHIGTKIKYYRLLNKISLSKLANEANISKSTLFGLEEGRSNPTISTLINIATTLDIDLNELIGSGLKDSEISSQLTLISVPNNENYKLYKLTLSTNELFILNEHSNKMLEIELIDGSLNLVDNSIKLYKGNSTKVKNSVFKANDSGAIALIKIYFNNDILYLKEDIFKPKATKELLEELSKISINRLITRAVFNTLTPIGELKLPKYINLTESIEGKESHYYFYKRYLGLIGGLVCLLNKIDIKPKELNSIEEFIKKATNKQFLNKNEYKNIDTTPLNTVKTLIINSLKEYDSSIIKVDNLDELSTLELKQNQKVYLLEDMLNNSDSNLSKTLTIKIYRALESLFTIKEDSLSATEQKIYSLIITNLPKALYYAYMGYTDIAISYLENLIELYEQEPIVEESTDILNNYITVIERTKDIKRGFNNSATLTSINLVENIAKDLNLKIEIKELISPVLEESGLYCYIFIAN